MGWAGLLEVRSGGSVFVYPKLHREGNEGEGGRERGGGNKTFFLLWRTNFIGGLAQHWVGCEEREVMILETCLCTRTVRLICSSPFSTRVAHFPVFLALLGAGSRIVRAYDIL